MPTVHTVEQGEHLPAIAARYGFANYLHLWEDPANAELKELRKNPNVLYAGDHVTIPDIEVKSVSCSSGALHRFRVSAPGVLLRLIVRDASGEPVANTDCDLEVDGRRERVTTDGEGRIEREIPSTAREGHLKIKNDEIPIEIDMHIGIGHLDPVDTVTGQIARLNNLGYDAGPVEVPADEEEAARNRSAAEEFQCDQGLKVDGVCGPKTQDKLKEAHGC